MSIENFLWINFSSGLERLLCNREWPTVTIPQIWLVGIQFLPSLIGWDPKLGMVTWYSRPLSTCRLTILDGAKRQSYYFTSKRSKWSRQVCPSGKLFGFIFRRVSVRDAVVTQRVANCNNSTDLIGWDPAFAFADWLGSKTWCGHVVYSWPLSVTLQSL